MNFTEGQRNPEIQGKIYSAREWLNQVEAIKANSESLELTTLSVEFQTWFQGSRAVNENNMPWLFHVTSELNFTKFDIDRMDFGIHAGTFDQAYTMGKNLIDYNAAKHLRLIRLAMKLINPWFCPDLGVWSPFRIYYELGKTNVANVEECDQMMIEFKQRIKTGDYRKEQARCRAYLQRLGFDGIGYVNTADRVFNEQTSWLALRPDQIWCLT